MNRIKLLPLFVSITIFALCSCVSDEADRHKGAEDEAGTTAPQTDLPEVAASTIEYSFIVVGCNRIGWSDDEKKPDMSHETVWRNSPYFNAAHTNINQLKATFADVTNLAHKPDYFFFVGDLVLAENADSSVLDAQLAAWVKLYNSQPIAQSGIKMVAIPGNHEFLYSLYPQPGEKPLAAANNIWLGHMQNFIIGNNGPGKGGADNLKQDESQLTYSVDHKGDHFVIMNTDTYDEVGGVPVNWITADMTTWRNQNPSGHMFLLGHKPAYTQRGDSDLAAGVAESLWSVMKATKAEAMLASHEHLFWAGQPVSGQSSWQVIAGNGGTKLQNKAGDPGHYFGFTEVQVMTDGTVKAISHGRDQPDPDWGPLAPGATTVRETFDLTWKN